ncbi:U3 snoRNP protein [Histoplasma ohiense]|nr:U3 snoRNP protein [Histoplasma ohiense (nom. inval.)]
MATASDKARFYLEKLVPEFKEYEKKKIFSKDEIAAILKKRSDFEHRINATGPKPADYAQYAAYEMNLDTLRRKRIKRLGVKSPMHSGQRRVFFILDRATKKFHGDISLWMQYIEYARRQKAYKKLGRIFMNALRLHPTKAELWICAARYALEDHGDMTQARSYMQRGLRFCKSSKLLWLQYAKLEMLYITRITTRQQILGLDGTRKSSSMPTDSATDPNADVIALPVVTEEDINPSLRKEDGVDEAALENLNSTPALTGAIPIAIFDAAMKRFGNDDAIGRDFYVMVSEFTNTPCLRRVLGRIVEFMMAENATSPHAQICYIMFPTAGIEVTSARFPQAFGTSLSRLKECKSHNIAGNKSLAKEIVAWLQPLMTLEGLDPDLQKVMRATLRNVEGSLS